MHVQVSDEEQFNDTLKKFWDLRSIGVEPVEMTASTSHKEAMVLQKFKDTLVCKDGRYKVSLPWKEEKAALKDKYKQVESRLCNLEKKVAPRSS